MKILVVLLAWCILLVLSWPLAMAVLLIWPLLWLLSLPFLLIGVVFTAIFALLTAILLLPARLLGWRPRERRAT